MIYQFAAVVGGTVVEDLGFHEPGTESGWLRMGELKGRHGMGVSVVAVDGSNAVVGSTVSVDDDGVAEVV